MCKLQRTNANFRYNLADAYRSHICITNKRLATNAGNSIVNYNLCDVILPFSPRISSRTIRNVFCFGRIVQIRHSARTGNAQGICRILSVLIVLRQFPCDVALTAYSATGAVHHRRPAFAICCKRHGWYHCQQHT